ncbi:MAG TPA: YraN family protein [Acidimicrobiales bacterium]
MASSRQAFGAYGERLAAQWYEKQGYEVLARNWRCREGELDLILARDSTVVFCEVKARATNAYGSGLEAVTPAKQARIRRLAVRFLAEAALGRRELRFDVAAVTGTELHVVEAAF